MTKGIKDLLARKLAENSKRHAEAEQQPFFEDGRQHVKLALDQIDPNPYQPRRDFPKAELEALAASIAEAGLLQPVSVRAVGGGRYQLIAGERRWRAHRLLGRPSIEALVVPAEDGDLAVLALAENLAREDLSDYEVGKALRQVETLFPTKKKLAEALGLNREDMYRYFAFESLPEAVRARLEQRPKLLARAAAADLKRLLQREARAGAVLEEAWPRLEAGSLDQAGLVALVAGRLKPLPEAEQARQAQPARTLASGDRVLGTMAAERGRVVIRLAAGALGEAQQEQLARFIEGLAGSPVAEDV